MKASTSLPKITLRRFEQLISSGGATIPQVTAYCRALAVAGEEILQLNAFTTLISATEVEEQAGASQRRWDAGTPLSPIDGLPISVKANLAVANQALTAGSAMLGATDLARTPAIGYTADTVRALQEKGAILIGVTHMDEFGMGILGKNIPSGPPTKNPSAFLDRSMGEDEAASLQRIQKAVQAPLDDVYALHEQIAVQQLSAGVDYSAGGSSCGSAASVAHGSSLLSLGSDTGGSVRIPAAWCQIASLRPTYGRLSRYGLVSYASSFDTVGLLANTTDCLARAFGPVLHGNDPLHDSTLSPRSQDFAWEPSLESSQATSLAGLKVGIPEAFSVSEVPPEVREAWSWSAERLHRRGASVETIPTSALAPDLLQRSLAAYMILVSAEASSNLAKFDGFRYGVKVPEAVDEWVNDSRSKRSLLEHQYAAARAAGFGNEVALRILTGTAALASDFFAPHYEVATQLRADLTETFHRTLEDYDLLLVPTTLFPPPPLDQHDMTPAEIFANDIMATPASLAGLPALNVSVPVQNSSILPFQPGMQLIGRPFGEATLFRAAASLESAI
jgi:aspartyl-tRNA(Asn)/glutamyl-tRNA(Gln) amidotransferase subunit A